MSLSIQSLPSDESFGGPDWSIGTVGSALTKAVPFYFWYGSWNLSADLLASDAEYASCPFKVGGQLECADFARLFNPDVTSFAVDMPAHMTDTVEGSQEKKRGFIAREEAAFNHDGLSVEASFGVFDTGTSTLGSAIQGSSGSSPAPGARRAYPVKNDSATTNINNTSLQMQAQGTAAGPHAPIDVVAQPGTESWSGCAVALRVGGGRPLATSSGGSPSISSQWSWRRIDGYVFAAYPVVNGSAQDLTLEVWRFNTNASDQQIPTLLAKQVVAGGGPSWKHDRPYQIRLAVVNAGGNPTFTAFISDYEQDGVATERQCFRDAIFTSSTITVGPSGDGAANTTTGVVTDSGTLKIAAYADKTVGVCMGRDRTVNTLPFLVGGSFKTALEGLYRLTGTRTDTSVIVYNDLFQRTPIQITFPSATFAEYIEAQNAAGWSCMGLFQQDSGGTPNALSGNLTIQRSLVWTDSLTDSDTFNDYLTYFYDGQSSAFSQVAGVPRFAWHNRPSTQFYNHHRIISFVGSTDAATAVANTFRIGLSCRGQVAQTAHNIMVFYALYTTDGSGNQISLTLRISRWAGSYGVEPVEYVVAEKVVHSSGTPPAGFDIAGGTTRTMGLKIERYTDGTTPTAAAQYTAYWAGAAYAFDTFFESAVQDGTTQVITHPAPVPTTTSGSTEGFLFSSVNPKLTGAALNYTDPKFTNWAEGAMADDPSTDGDTITVAGEGSPSVNLSTVVYVDWQLSVQYFRPRYSADFESGHRYASPQSGKSRRRISARAENVSKATFDAITAFYDSRSGVEQAFYFDFPVPSALGSNTLTQIAVCFTSTGLKTTRKTEGVYTVELEMIEVFV